MLQVMKTKTMNIAYLKAHLSAVLRLVAAGAHIVVLDRKRPVAELIPPVSAEDLAQRLHRKYGMKIGTQDWATFKPVKLKKKVDFEKIIDWVQSDSIKW